jgi:hypothetical protein
MPTAPQTATTSSSERRIATRFQPAFGTVCRFRRRGEDGEEAVGLVWNISETGMSMLLADPPKRGAELDAELASESGGVGLAIALRVVHVREMPIGDYFLGAQFERPLASDELKRFLIPTPVPTAPANGENGTHK